MRILMIIVFALLSGIFFVWEEKGKDVGERRVQPQQEPAAVVPKFVMRENETSQDQEIPDPVSLSPIRYSTGTPEISHARERVMLDVPFQPQAPFGRWEQPWQDACEEASLVLANRFAHGTLTLSWEEMRDEILHLVDFQNGRYGDYKDSDTTRTAAIGREWYGIEFEEKEITSVDEIKALLEEGKLVIAPMAGRALGNPFFTPPGPWYHMLIILGYDDRAGAFITNDVGTRQGEGLRYSYEILWNALHDFPGEKERIEEGRKAVITVGRY